MAAIANKIVIGDDLENPILVFENAKIREVTSETAVSMIGDELFIDQFTPIVEYEVWVPLIFKPTDAKAFVSSDGKILCSRKNYDLRLLPYGTKITYYIDDSPGGEFFCKKVERVGKTQYKINAISAIGLMDKQFHLGGLYHGESFAEVLRDVTGPDYDYIVDGIVATQRVFGWLPYDTRRRNLHQLLVAFGVNIIKGDDGKMFFTFLETGTPDTIPSRRIVSGGSVVYDDPASQVEVTEHGFYYLPDVEEVTLFDNSASDVVTNALITFDEPIYPPSIHVEVPEGDTAVYMTIHSVGVNHAYVTGAGIVKGTPYVHAKRVIVEKNPNPQVEKVKQIEDVTLIGATNSQQAAGRLAAYYFHATTVKEDIILEYEKTGNQYILENPFNEKVTGFISRMSMYTSSNRRASCEVIQNYDPVGAGASYQNSVIIPLGENETASWTIPESVYENEIPSVRVVLIGRGYTGSKGGDGQEGGSNEGGTAKGGAGGVGGLGAAGGRVLIVTIDPIGLTSLEFENSGYNSLLTAGDLHYSSTNGSSRPYGYYDPFTDTIYATHGKPGVAGGNGGDSGYYTHNSSDENEATNGDDVVYLGETYIGGKRGIDDSYRGQRSEVTGASMGPLGWLSENLNPHFGPGGGGGAAAGANGGDAYPQQHLSYTEANQNFWDIGRGGHGADACPATPTENVYGAGGNGGHGGGGGGAGGNHEFWNDVYNALIYVEGGHPGHGGKGSDGGLGKYGCAIIYY